MNISKPMLTINEQIEHLARNGVAFDIISRENARNYLICNNNYFKLTAYRKNYDKYSCGTNVGKYIRLDFAYLVDLAIIDMKLRYQIMQMALDIEHHVKLKILYEVENHTGEDGYQIVTNYIESLSEFQKEILLSEIDRNKGNIYCGSIVDKYNKHYPVWAFLEIIPFGRLIGFYKFCGERFESKTMVQDFYCLLDCKNIRNAAAHNNCIINNLRSGTFPKAVNIKVNQAIMTIPEISKKFRRLKMSNVRIQQIITLLYVHKTFVKSNGLHKMQAVNLNLLVKRMYKNADYYSGNGLILSTFNFLKLVIDKWFPVL